MLYRVYVLYIDMWYILLFTFHIFSHSISLSCSYEAKASLYTNICTTYYLTFWCTYFDRNICWPMVIGGNQSSFRARNKSRTAIISIHDQPSILSLWNEVDCYVQPAEKDTCEIVHRYTFSHKLHANHFLSAHSIYIYTFFMLAIRSPYCWSEDDCCVQSAEKSISFICDMCIVHRTTIRSVHSDMQRTATSVPTQYYIYLSAALVFFDQASWWVV